VLAAVVVLALPVLTGQFERTPGAGALGLLLIAILGSAVAGTALAALFSRPIVRNRVVPVLGLSACALLTVPLSLPPVVPTAQALDTTRASEVPGRLLPGLLGIAVVACAVAAACTLLWRRAE